MARAPRLLTPEQDARQRIEEMLRAHGINEELPGRSSSFGEAMRQYTERFNRIPEGRMQDNPGVDYTQQPLGPNVRSGASVSRGQADTTEAEMNQRGPGLMHEISNRQGGRMARKLPPASIRYNNPGAMYPGPVSKHFGSTPIWRSKSVV